MYYDYVYVYSYSYSYSIGKNINNKYQDLTLLLTDKFFNVIIFFAFI